MGQLQVDNLLQVNHFGASEKQTTAKKWPVLSENQHSTDPFADLSVDEDQVIQGQNYLCRSTVTTSKAGPNPATFPRQNKGQEKKNNLSILLRSHKIETGEIFFDILMYILQSNEEVNSKSNQCSDQK